MTSTEQNTLKARIATILNDGSVSRTETLERLLETVEGNDPGEVSETFVSLIDENRDRVDDLGRLLEKEEVDSYFTDGGAAQRALLGAAQSKVAKHDTSRRDSLVPNLVEGLGDPARRSRMMEVLEQISTYKITTARSIAEELEEAPSSMYGDPSTIEAVEEVLSSMEEKHRRFKGDIKMPPVARLQMDPERQSAKEELHEQVRRCKDGAEEAMESMASLLDTADKGGRISKDTERAAREVVFEIAIEYPSVAVSRAHHLVETTGIGESDVVKAYRSILEEDVGAAEDLFASVVVKAVAQDETDEGVETVESLLPDAPDNFRDRILEDVSGEELRKPPISEEVADEIGERCLLILKMLWDDSVSPVGSRLLAIDLEAGEEEVVEDVATVVEDAPSIPLLHEIAGGLDLATDIPSEPSERLSASVWGYLEATEESHQTAARLMASSTSVGGTLLDRLTEEMESEDEEAPITQDDFHKMIEVMREIDPSTVVFGMAPLLNYAVGEEVHLEVLDTVREAASKTSATAVEDEREALDMLTDLLHHEKDDVVARACRIITYLEPYPAPEELKDVKEDPERDIERVTEWALEYIEDHKPASNVDLPRVNEGGESVVSQFSREDKLKYRRRGLWEPTELGELERCIVDSVAEHYRDGESVLVTHPSRTPRVSLLYTLTLMCEGVAGSETPEVGLVAPVWQNRWGTFGDIEEEYARYGVSDREGTTLRAPSFNDMFGTGKVSGDELSVDHGGPKDGRIVLAKSLDSLSKVADELTAVVVHAVERFTAPLDDLVEEMGTRFEDTPVFLVYSTTTKLDTGGVASLRPPSVPSDSDVEVVDLESALETLAETFPDEESVKQEVDLWSEEDETPGHLETPSKGALQASGYTRPKEVQIRAVGDDNLRESLNEAMDIGFELDEESGRVLGTTFRYERLPVDASRFDEWVDDREWANPRVSVGSFKEQLDDIEESTDGDHISSSTVIEIRECLQALDSVDEVLRERNPLSERLRSRLEEVLEEGDRVGVVVASKSFAEATREVLEEDTDFEIGEEVVVTTPEGVSESLVLDRLFVVGPQRPEHASVYYPSCTSQVEVLNIGGHWDGYVEKYARKYRESLVEALKVDDGCLGEMSVEIVDETQTTEEPETPEVRAEDSGETQTASTGSSGGGRGSGDWVPESLADAFDIADPAEGDTTSEGLEYVSRPTYEARTDGGETLELGRGEAIYRIEDGASGERSYSRTSPSQVEPGDEMLVVNPGFVKEHRQRWLMSQYESQFDDTQEIFTGLYDWWEGMADILSRLDSETDDDIGRADPVVERFYNAVESDVDKSRQAVRLWIDSIEDTTEAMELAAESDNVIGPNSASDIEAIGNAFDHQKFVEEAEAIQRAMDKIRKFNSIGGRRYRKVIEERLEEGDQRFRDAATPYHVTDIEKIDD